MTEDKMANTSGDNDIIEAVVVEGITEDFVWYEADRLLRDMKDFGWYEADRLLRDMSGWESRLKKLVSVMEARHKEHLEMLGDMRRQINQQQFEITSLKEKLNASS